MNKILRNALTLLLLALTAACRGPRQVPEPPAGQVVIPQTRPAAGAPAPTADGARPGAQAPSPRVPLAEGERVLEMIDTNLDADPADEQVLAVQAGEGQPIRIITADYDEIRQVWRRGADYATQATNSRAFRVETEDIIGDYGQEIVAQGLAADSTTTLDVLRRVPAASGTGLSFAPIIRVSADRSITIERHRRPQSYQFGQRFDDSFPIIVERRDPRSENPLDTVRETWHWRNQDRRYARTLEERIPSEQLAQKQMAQLFSASATQADYEQFLAGPWYRRNDVKSLLVFEQGSIIFSDGDVQEAYRIEFFTRWGNTIRLDARNVSLSQIKKWFSLVIVSPNTVRMEVRATPWIAEEDQWSGEYLRLTPDLQQSILAARERGAGGVLPLVGVFRGGDGTEIAFDSPTFTWITPKGESSSGGFGVREGLPLLNPYYLERDLAPRLAVVTFKFLQEGALKSTDTSYLLEYREKAEASALVRSVSLTPVKLTIRGAVATSREPVVLEQIEMKSEPVR